MDTRLRLTLAASLSLLPLVPLTVRLANLQIMQHDSLDIRAREEFSRSTEEVVPRADIVDRNGKALAQSLPVWACFIDKRMVAEPRALAVRLAPLTGLSAAEIVSRYDAQGRFAWVSRGLTYEQSQAIGAAKLEGVGLISSQQRFYPNGDLARNVLGTVNADGHGAAGIELSQDQRLSGKPRRLRVIRDGSGRSIYKSVEEGAPAPEPLRLTIDRNVQYYAEEILREAAGRLSIASGIAAVQDPNTGEILAMASYPANPLKNPLIQDSYEPGSTFKVVAAAAALEESAVSEGDRFFCENGTYEIAPRVFIHDHEPAGELTLAGILEHSSNIGIAKVAEKVGALRFYRYARAFGFANRTGIALPGETGGEIKPLSDMTKVGLAAASYGYGIGVSPLQVLSAYSAIANGGTLWEPRILKDSQRPSRVRRVASPRTARILGDMLEGVVSHGTALTAQVAGYRVAGKTGTARRLDALTGKYSTTDYNASFVGYLPAGRPQWTILVVIANPKGVYYGAQAAAPVFAKLGRELLTLRGIAPDRPGEVGLASVPAP